MFRGLIRRGAILVSAGCLLVGCRVDAEVRVRAERDGSGTVALTVVADKDVVARSPGLAGDLRLDDARTAGWTVTGPEPTPEGGLRVRLEKPFATPAQANAVLAELSGPTGPLTGMSLTQTHSFAHTETVLSGQVGVEGGLTAFSDAGLATLLGGSVPLADQVAEPLSEHLAIVVTADLPGVGDEAKPQVPFGRRETLTLRGVLDDPRARRARAAGRALAIAAGVGIAASLGLALLLLPRRRRSAE